MRENRKETADPLVTLCENFLKSRGVLYTAFVLRKSAPYVVAPCISSRPKSIFPLSKNIPKKALNADLSTALRFGRDDKGEGGASRRKR